MKVVSIVLRTESGDLYHFTWEVGCVNEFIENIEETMGEELASVYTFDINQDDVDEEFRKALNKAHGEEVY